MDKCLARNANVKIFTLNRFTWNFLGLGLTCGASGSMASFSNLKIWIRWSIFYQTLVRTMTMFSHLFFSLEAVSKAHPFSSTKLMYPPSSPTLASHSSNFARRALALAASWQWIGHYLAPHRETGYVTLPSLLSDTLYLRYYHRSFHWKYTENY